MLKEFYKYLKDNHYIAFDNNKDIELLDKTLEKLEHRNRNVHLDFVSKLEKDIATFGKEEIVWIYFKEDRKMLIPYQYKIPKREKYYSNEATVEMQLQHALEAFKLL